MGESFDSPPSWVTSRPEEESFDNPPSWVTSSSQVPSTVLDDDKQEEVAKFYLPEGVTQGSYTQDTMVEDDRLYQPIHEFMKLRYGLQSVEGKSRTEIVDQFLNNRRGNAFGNSVRAVSEADFLYDIKEDPNKLAKVGKAYGIYENMADLFSDETTPWERAEGIMDVTRTILADPINLVGGIVGKAVGGTASRMSINTLNRMANQAALKELAKKGTTKAGQEAAAKAMRGGAKGAVNKLSIEVAETANKLRSTKGFKRVMTKAGLKEVAGATAVDAIAATGTEWLYQRSLVDTGVQDEVNPYAVGLASLSAMAMGGIQAARVATRGSSDTVLVSEAVQQGEPKKIAAEMKKSIKEYLSRDLNKPEGYSSWWSKVDAGEELAAKDTEFFIELLLGRTVKEGDDEKVIFKGLGQIMQENGFYYVKRSDEDTIGNWVADFLSEMDDEDVRGILKTYTKHSGNRINRLKKLTAKQFAETFSNKVSQAGQTMNSLRQMSDNLKVDIDDLEVEHFLERTLGSGILKKEGDKKFEFLGAGFSKAQSNMIRSLVSHPSTSMLNLVGYGSASAIGSASDIATAIIHASRGALYKMGGMNEKGVNQINIAKVLVEANLNRVKFLLDPDMTQEAFKSALTRNTGALEQLVKIQSGGVEVSNGIKELSKLGITGRNFWSKTDEGVDLIQALTFVDAQDIFTKSQEYIFQMDKNLRMLHGMGWNEFYSHPDAARMMATKEYRELEAKAVTKTLEPTFSKSYRGTDTLGKMAGIIEEARNIPGVGILVPFGKFFNNTIDFMVKHSPASPFIKKFGVAYEDVSYEELFGRVAVAAGLVAAFSEGEDEKRRQGLGLYDTIDPMTGEVRSKQYDYPLSLFQAAGRVSSYIANEEEVPDGIVTQIIYDFFGGSLTRNISKSGNVLVDAVKAMIQADLEKAAELGKQSVASIGTQFVSAGTRFLDPINELVGLVMPERVERRPELNQHTGVKKQLKDAMRYFDNFAEIITGKTDDAIKQSSSEGMMDPMGTKMLGTRTEMMTDTLRLMNMLGLDSWSENAAFKVTKQTPIAGNKYQKHFFNMIEALATQRMANKTFRSLDRQRQLDFWEKDVETAKTMSMIMLSFEDGVTGADYYRFELANKNTIKDIKDAKEELDIDVEIQDMNLETLMLIESYLETKDTVRKLGTPAEAY